MYFLAFAYINGVKCPKSMDMASKFALHATRHGHPKAQNTCAMIAFQRRQHAEALQWWTLSAAQGGSASQRMLGNLCYGTFIICQD
jgi:TPR repeat protein